MVEPVEPAALLLEPVGEPEDPPPPGELGPHVGLQLLGDSVEPAEYLWVAGGLLESSHQGEPLGELVEPQLLGGLVEPGHSGGPGSLLEPGSLGGLGLLGGVVDLVDLSCWPLFSF